MVRMARAGALGVMALTLGVGMALASCGTSSSPEPGDGGVEGASSGGGCPAAVPAAGTPCSQPVLQCEYGPFAWNDCNTTATCGSTQWSVAPPPAGAICAPNNTFCPASASAISHGGACEHPGIECFFREATCACLSGGATDAGAAWACDDPAPGCPTPRPLLGQPCSQEGQVCDYAACALHNIAQRCSAGVWRFVSTECDGG
jgi:hypothetical protein